MVSMSITSILQNPDKALKKAKFISRQKQGHVKKTQNQITSKTTAEINHSKQSTF